MPDTKILTDEEFLDCLPGTKEGTAQESDNLMLLAHNAALKAERDDWKHKAEESQMDAVEWENDLLDLQNELAFARLAVEILNDIDLRWEKESVSYNLYPKDEKQHAEFEARVKAYLAARAEREKVI